MSDAPSDATPLDDSIGALRNDPPDEAALDATPLDATPLDATPLEATPLEVARLDATHDTAPLDATRNATPAHATRRSTAPIAPPLDPQPLDTNPLDAKRPDAPPLRPNLDSPWALGTAAYEAVVAHLRTMNARVLVEFGSGSSTIALSQDLPKLAITSIEHDPRFLEATRAALGANATLEHRPLTWQRHGGAPYLSYTPGPFPAEVDAVIIDGPPFWTRRGREACLYQCFGALRVGGRIFLDDYERLGERRIVRHWLRGFPGALRVVEIIEESGRVAVLEKTADATFAPSALVRIDAKAQALMQPLTSRIRTAALRLRGIDH